MSYTTIEDVALFLNRDIAELTSMEVAQIGMSINYIDGLINNYCGWNMLNTSYVGKRFDGSGVNSLDLRLYPINAITQVKVRADDGTFTDVTDGIEVLDDGIIQFLPYADTDVTVFTSGTKNWYISFNAGYLPGEVPQELSYAASYLVTLHFNKIIDENLGSEDEKFEGTTFKNTSLAIPPTVTRTLDRFRMVSVY